MTVCLQILLLPLPVHEQLLRLPQLQLQPEQIVLVEVVVVGTLL